jgi:DNA-binding NtrC family response regulator
MARIVAVDDEAQWLELYAEGLQEAGHRVESFNDGTTAIAAIRSDPPDLVILDIRMGPSGRQVLKSIREAHPALPVVMSSAYGGYRSDPDFASANGFVEKSTDLTELIDTVRSILAQSETRR